MHSKWSFLRPDGPETVCCNIHSLRTVCTLPLTSLLGVCIWLEVYHERHAHRNSSKTVLRSALLQPSSYPLGLGWVGSCDLSLLCRNLSGRPPTTKQANSPEKNDKSYIELLTRSFSHFLVSRLITPPVTEGLRILGLYLFLRGFRSKL